MNDYVYVKKEQVTQARREFESVLRRAESYIRENCPDLEFMWMHVGSIGRVLATCRREDQGVDLAYDLLIEYPGTGRELDGRKVYQIFLDALEHAVDGTGYSVSDGPSSLFTLINDGDGIVSRCDLSVVCYDSPRDLRYLSHEENGGYGFMEHRLWLNIDSAVDRILEDDPDNWELIRYRYLQLKNSGRRAEIPYLLFADAVESVHRRLCGDSDGQANKSFRPIFATSEFV